MKKAAVFCLGCYWREKKQNLMHEIDWMSGGIIRGYWCLDCDWLYEVNLPRKGIKEFQAGLKNEVAK